MADALTAQDWDAVRDRLCSLNAEVPHDDGDRARILDDILDLLDDVDGFRHALAALCLHGQPYGFTMEDVAVLRRVAWADTGEGGTDVRMLPGIADAMADLIDRAGGPVRG